MKAGTIARLGLAIAGILLAGAAAGAQGPGGRGSGGGFGQHTPPFERAFGGHGDHEWWNNPKTVADLKLTDAQRKAMDGILLSHRETLIDLRGSLEKAELAMQPLMKEDQPNEARILAQIDKVAQARAELEKANARFLLAIRGQLTPDQWKQLQADREKRAEDARNSWGRGGSSRGGSGPGMQRPGMQRPGGQYRRQQPPAGAPPAPGAAPAAQGPQTMNDGGADSNGVGAPQAGAAQ